MPDEKESSDNSEEERSAATEGTEDKNLSEENTEQGTKKKKETTGTDVVNCMHSYRTRYCDFTGWNFYRAGRKGSDRNFKEFSWMLMLLRL